MVEDIDGEKAMKNKNENDLPLNTNDDIVDAMTSDHRNGRKSGEGIVIKKRNGK